MKFLVASLLSALSFDLDSEFKSFIARHNKVYEQDFVYNFRKEVFRKNMAWAHMASETDETADYGATQFADWTPEEFDAIQGYKIENAHSAYSNATLAAPLNAGAAPASVDWRTNGAVTGVKNQGQCGSCWSFSTTGDIEGSWFNAGNKLTSLSEEELVQCDTNGDQGCNGGLPSQAMEWIIKNGGIVTESTYPYTSGGGDTGTCQKPKESPVAVKISSWEKVSQDEDQIAAYIAQNGPVSIGIHAGLGLQMYSSGIYDPFFGCSGSLNHGVLIVGYGVEKSKKYWIIKNSWGESWGESGYFRIIRGKKECGLNQMVVHSKV